MAKIFNRIHMIAHMTDNKTESRAINSDSSINLPEKKSGYHKIERKKSPTYAIPPKKARAFPSAPMELPITLSAINPSAKPLTKENKIPNKLNTQIGGKISEEFVMWITSYGFAEASRTNKLITASTAPQTSGMGEILSFGEMILSDMATPFEKSFLVLYQNICRT